MVVVCRCVNKGGVSLVVVVVVGVWTDLGVSIDVAW